MSLDEKKTIIRRLFEAVNRRNLALLDDLIAPDYVDLTFQRQGLENLKQLLTKFFKTFPDWHETIEDIIAEGNKVWIRVKYTATHTQANIVDHYRSCPKEIIFCPLLAKR